MRYLAILIFTFGLSIYLNAQIYNFSKYSLDEGLSQSQIYDMCEDSLGRLWFGTLSGGISVYDGSKTINYSLSSGLPSYCVSAIYCSKAGKIYAGTNLGCALYQNNQFKHLKTADEDFTETEVWDFAENTIGTVFFAGTNGIGVIEEDSLYKLNSSKIPDTQVYAITIDKNDKLWLGLNGYGIYKYNLKNDSLTEIINITGDICNYLYYENNTIWACLSNGLYRIKNDEKTFYNMDSGLPGNDISAIVAVNDSSYWISTYRSGISFFDGKKFKNICEKQGLSSNLINRVRKDKQGKIWFLSDGAGANSFLGEKFVHYEYELTGAQDVIMAVLTTEKINYMGTGGSGIYLVENNKPKLISNNKNVLLNQIGAIIKDNKERILVGTEAGLATIKNNTIELFVDKDGEYTHPVTSIYQLSSGEVLIGTNGGGLYELNNNDIKISHIDSLLPHKTIWSILQYKNKLYIGTDNGLCVLESYKEDSIIKLYSTKDGIANKSIRGFTKDKYGNLWFTTDMGMSMFDGNKFRNYTKSNGISSDVIYIVTQDTLGRLILGLEKGIDVLEIDKNGNILKKDFYGKKEGFKNIECNSNAFDIDKFGRLWIGTISGITVFNPYLNDVNNYSNTHINNVKLYRETINDTKYCDELTGEFNLPKNLVLPYNQNNLTFGFYSEEKQTPEKVLYKYRLKGFENDWSPTTRSQSANYTNIPSGEYTFEVTSCNSSGIWDKTPATISFIVLKPFYKTLWFIFLSIAILASIIFSYIKIRTSRLIKAKKMLEKEVAERTEEIVAQKEEIEVKNDKLQDAYKSITDSVRYAKRIQEAGLPAVSILKESFPESFVFYKPKDIVSGDFYYFTRINEFFLLAAADCTGHGVPGALMSMIGQNTLNQIVNDKSVTLPSQVLKLLNKKIVKNLRQNDESGIADGMDISFCCFNLNTKKLLYAGAFRPLILIRNGEIIKYQADRYAIGGYYIGKKTFTDQEIELQKDDILYLFSDGFIDQFGGPKHKKFMIKNFLKLLKSIKGLPMDEQKVELQKTFENWKGNEEQIDDILVIGIKIV